MSMLTIERINDYKEIYGLDFKNAKRVLEIEVTLDRLQQEDAAENYETITNLLEERETIID